MSQSQVSKVVIAGGGVTGMTLALALRQRGVEVVLAEQKPTEDEWLNVGHGITLQGNSLKMFASVGILDELLEHGYPFNKLCMFDAKSGDLLVELPTPPMGGPDKPGTAGARRSDLAKILAAAMGREGVDVRLGTTVASYVDHGDSVEVTLSDGTVESADLFVVADGIRSQTRKLLGITDEPSPVGMGIWRVIAKRPPEMVSSGIYEDGPKYRAGYTPISEDYCYIFLLEENLDRSLVGATAPGAVFKEHGAGYGGVWGKVRDSIADDEVANYQWIESICVERPWYTGRAVAIGDAVHACPPTIAQGAAMGSEDAVVLAELITSGQPLDEALPAFFARRFPRVKMVLENSLALAYHDMDPTNGTNPGQVMGSTLHALCEPA